MSKLEAPIPIHDVLDLLDESGVYEIACIKTGRVYVGQSTSIVARVKQHVSTLEKNCHSNKLLQRDWNEYSSDSFMFRLVLPIPYTDTDGLMRQEQKEIERREKYNIPLYNNTRLVIDSSPAEKGPQVPPPTNDTEGIKHPLYYSGSSHYKPSRPDVREVEKITCYDCGTVGGYGQSIFRCSDDKQSRCEICIDAHLSSTMIWIQNRERVSHVDNRRRYRWGIEGNNIENNIVFAASAYARKYNLNPKQVLIYKDSKPISVDGFNVIRDEYTPKGYIDIYEPSITR